MPKALTDATEFHQPVTTDPIIKMESIELPTKISVADTSPVATKPSQSPVQLAPVTSSRPPNADCLVPDTSLPDLPDDDLLGIDNDDEPLALMKRRTKDLSPKSFAPGEFQNLPYGPTAMLRDQRSSAGINDDVRKSQKRRAESPDESKSRRRRN